MTDPRTALLLLCGLSVCAFSVALWAAVGLVSAALSVVREQQAEARAWRDDIEEVRETLRRGRND